MKKPVLPFAKRNHLRKRTKILVRIKKEKEKRLKNGGFFFERKILGFREGFLIQAVKYEPEFNSLSIKVNLKGTKEPLGKLDCQISGNIAEIKSVKVIQTYRNNLIASQMIAQSVDALRKIGVRKVTADVVTKSDSIYKALGFESKGKSSSSGGIIYEKKF
jgi:hypothetical protein